MSDRATGLVPVGQGGQGAKLTGSHSHEDITELYNFSLLKTASCSAPKQFTSLCS